MKRKVRQKREKQEVKLLTGKSEKGKRTLINMKTRSDVSVVSAHTHKGRRGNDGE